ncbi:MAG TPA: DUF5103 domain-containing protein [Chitinophagaceae bacterium]|nr:DUF5103 domain-containing protein [Chitinophagaceae bacterium]
MIIRKSIVLVLCCLAGITGRAQVNAVTPDHVYMDNIKTVKFSAAGNALAIPVIALGGSDQASLSFDDLDADVKNYYYTLVLCNADWKPANMNPFDYLRGFIENRVEDYHYSTIPLQHYTHYSVTIPNNNCMPTRSGDYLLKVYLNSDTSQLAFTRRLLVLENKAIIKGVIQQPVNPKTFQTHQKVNFSVSLQGINVNNALSQVKVFILQNGRWDNAIDNLKPTFIKGDELEYNTENDCIFPAGKEWRWADLRSFRLQTERVARIDYGKSRTSVILLPDYNRSHERYLYRRDLDGHYYSAILEQGYNPDFEGDYASVHFTFKSPTPFAGSDVYVFGELTNYECNASNRMTYNGADGAYECTLFLKQGYYNYMYGVIPMGGHKLHMNNTEGNWWEAENNYIILVYYRPLGGRADELIGMRTLNSLENR